MTLSEKSLAMQKLNAFRVFLVHGIDKVKKMYSDHVDFVKSNQSKTFSEVEKELLFSNNTDMES